MEHRGADADPAPDRDTFAFGVARSMYRGGFSQDNTRSLFAVITDFPQATIDAAIEDAYTPTAHRYKLVGKTPGVRTDTGLAVYARMAAEGNPADPKGRNMAYQDATGQWWVYSIRPANAGLTVQPSGYYKLRQCHMAHIGEDAVVWWNRVGKFLPRAPSGGPGEAVLQWMNDPNNYQLQLGSHNSSAGARLSATGPWWVAPVSG